MELIKLVVCICVLGTKICLAGLITKTSKLDESSLVEASIDIVESCYNDRISTIGLGGSSIESIVSKISTRATLIPITLINETSGVASHDPVNRGSRYKLQVFVITVSNPNILMKTLTQVKSSKWWNHMASFLLINLPVTENGCSNAAEILLVAWKMNLLNSKFVCLNLTRSRMIYTFNPYTSQAPAPWQKENTYTATDGHTWTLFVREYREISSDCDRLDFDKTVNLGGHEVRASVDGMEYWWSADPNVKPYLAFRVENVTAQILMSSLNATWKLLAKPWSGYFINLETGATSGVAAQVTSGISDVCLNTLIQHVFGNFETTYPLLQTHIAILTQYPGHKSQLGKIISVLDCSSRYGVFVVLSITLLIFKFWLGRPLTLAMLDVVLIVCNAALHKIPKKLASRIYLCSLFIFVVTIQGIYQSQFASMLTKKVRLKGIDKIGDLAHSDHLIYGPEPYRIYFNDSVFEGRYFANSDYPCPVLHDPKAACVGVVTELIDVAARLNLHLSRETLGVIYGVYLIRRDWPLEERVNVIFGRAAAGGIMETLYSRQRDSAINTIKSFENHEEEPTVKVLTLEQLRFAFVMLGIGLGCATVTFIIEVAIYGTAMANLCNRIQR